MDTTKIRVALYSALGAAVIGLGATATAGDSAADVLSKYEKTGADETCLNLSHVRDSDPLDDHAIMFELRGGDMYLNELDGRCTGLERERRFSYKTSQNKICKGDIITVTDNFGNFRGSCSLGAFEKISPIELASAE